MEVQAFGQGNSTDEIDIIGYINKKYRHMKGTRSMISELLDLDDTNNDVDTMQEFIPFSMIIIAEGNTITSMEIPEPETETEEEKE